ncbi:hypothetical protein EW146_g3525 [Bondarzewia mesenterica]|uniref:Zn(2)-C6 fungal-type domain-containing protein n=1 Tax=Bondarzewia mesenterica TaxID=1095465 RepID=A0A4S4LYR9_9AGAM|nr:hypothetical protein EW146_g3525 [Bondarzewia mesenterica]
MLPTPLSYTTGHTHLHHDHTANDPAPPQNVDYYARHYDSGVDEFEFAAGLYDHDAAAAYGQYAVNDDTWAQQDLHSPPTAVDANGAAWSTSSYYTQSYVDDVRNEQLPSPLSPSLYGEAPYQHSILSPHQSQYVYPIFNHPVRFSLVSPIRSAAHEAQTSDPQIYYSYIHGVYTTGVVPCGTPTRNTGSPNSGDSPALVTNVPKLEDFPTSTLYHEGQRASSTSQYISGDRFSLFQPQHLPISPGSACGLEYALDETHITRRVSPLNATRTPPPPALTHETTPLSSASPHGLTSPVSSPAARPHRSSPIFPAAPSPMDHLPLPPPTNPGVQTSPAASEFQFVLDQSAFPEHSPRPRKVRSLLLSPLPSADTRVTCILLQRSSPSPYTCSHDQSSHSHDHFVHDQGFVASISTTIPPPTATTVSSSTVPPAGPSSPAGSALPPSYPRTKSRGGQAIHKAPQPTKPRKKPALACLFCRERKIACGPPPPGSDDMTCKYVTTFLPSSVVLCLGPD